MDLNALVEMQHKFDSDHGWSLRGEDPRELLAMVSSDLVGILGELGEFANLVKKLQRDQVGLEASAVATQIAMVRPNLSEELTDAFIYIIRLAAHLGIDMEEAYVRKLDINRKRYASRESK